MIHEHLLIFRTGKQALDAKRALPCYVNATRSKVSEHEGEPVVVFETENELSLVTRVKLARALGTLDVRFNQPGTRGQELVVQPSFPGIDWTQK